MKILYIVARSSYGEVERKILHYLVALKDRVDLSVAVLVDSPLQKAFKDNGIKCHKLQGYSGLTNHLQFEQYDIIHFYGSRRLCDLASQYGRDAAVVESVFSSKIADTSSLDRSSVYTIFENQDLYERWGSPPNSIVFPFTLNRSIKRNTGLLSKFQAGLTGKTVIGTVCNSAEDLNLSLLFQLNGVLESYKDPATIVIACSSSLVDSLKKKTQAAKNITIKAYSEDIVGCFDVFLGLDRGETSISALEMVHSSIPIVVPQSNQNQILLKSLGKVGFLYNPTGSVELLRQYCLSASKMDLKTVKIPPEFDLLSKIDEVVSFYQNAVSNKKNKNTVARNKTQQKKESKKQEEPKQPEKPEKTLAPDQMTYYIVPYAIHGGAEVYLKNHIEAMEDKSKVAVLFVARDTQLEKELKGKVRTAVVGNLVRLGNYILTNKIKNVCFYNSKAVYQLLSRLKKIQPLYISEIIHSVHRWKDSMHGVSRDKVDKVIAVSSQVARQWQLSSYEVIPPRIDKERFKNIPKKKSPYHYTIGTVARISQEKNLFRVVDIAEKLDDSYRFVIIGKDGGAKAALQNYIKKKRLTKRVLIKDYTPHIEQEYAAFDAFLLTSKVEGTPLTILEAQAAGVPVVAPDIGAIKEMMIGHKGYVYNQGDSAAKIAARVKQLVRGGKKTKKQKNKVVKANAIYPREINFVGRFHSNKIRGAHIQGKYKEQFFKEMMDLEVVFIDGSEKLRSKFDKSVLDSAKWNHILFPSDLKRLRKEDLKRIEAADNFSIGPNIAMCKLLGSMSPRFDVDLLLGRWIVADSYWNKRALLECFPQIDEDKVVVIETYIDPMFYHQPTSPKREFTIGLVGYPQDMDNVKNLHLLPELCKAKPHWNFELCVNRPSVPSTFRKVPNLKIHLEVKRSDLPEIMSQWSCYLGISKVERGPATIQECKALGIPTIAPNHTGYEEFNPSIKLDIEPFKKFSNKDIQKVLHGLEKIEQNRESFLQTAKNEKESFWSEHNPTKITRKWERFFKDRLEKMKILVVLPKIKRIGGSIATVLAFADIFKELEHDVTILSSEDPSLKFFELGNSGLNELLNFYDCKNLVVEDFVINTEYCKETWPRGGTQNATFFEQFDLIFSTGRFTTAHKIPHVAWVIHAPDIRPDRNVIEYWTNSRTTAEDFPDRILHVVRAPHDYSMFRNLAQQDREYSFVHIARCNEYKEKGILPFTQIIKNGREDESLLISTTKTESDKEILESLEIPYEVNLPREKVAEILAKSRFLLFPSYNESCPLVIYEALNAGCIPIARNVGAIREQVGDLGVLFDEDNEIEEAIDRAHRIKYSMEDYLARGITFDRTNIKDLIRTRLKEIRDKIK